MPFPPFDRCAVFAESKGKDLAELLDICRAFDVAVAAEHVDTLYRGGLEGAGSAA